MIVEDSETEPTETEPTENTLSADGMLTIEPNVQASNYNYQQQSQVTNGNFVVLPPVQNFAPTS